MDNPFPNGNFVPGNYPPVLPTHVPHQVYPNAMNPQHFQPDQFVHHNPHIPGNSPHVGDPGREPLQHSFHAQHYATQGQPAHPNYTTNPSNNFKHLNQFENKENNNPHESNNNPHAPSSSLAHQQSVPHFLNHLPPSSDFQNQMMQPNSGNQNANPQMQIPFVHQNGNMAPSHHHHQTSGPIMHNHNGQLPPHNNIEPQTSDYRGQHQNDHAHMNWSYNGTTGSQQVNQNNQFSHHQNSHRPMNNNQQHSTADRFQNSGQSFENFGNVGHQIGGQQHANQFQHSNMQSSYGNQVHHQMQSFNSVSHSVSQGVARGNPNPISQGHHQSQGDMSIPLPNQCCNQTPNNSGFGHNTHHPHSNCFPPNQGTLHYHQHNRFSDGNTDHQNNGNQLSHSSQFNHNGQINFPPITNNQLKNHRQYRHQQNFGANQSDPRGSFHQSSNHPQFGYPPQTDLMKSPPHQKMGQHNIQQNNLYSGNYVANPTNQFGPHGKTLEDFRGRPNHPINQSNGQNRNIPQNNNLGNLMMSQQTVNNNLTLQETISTGADHMIPDQTLSSINNFNHSGHLAQNADSVNISSNTQMGHNKDTEPIKTSQGQLKEDRTYTQLDSLTSKPCEIITSQGDTARKDSNSMQHGSQNQQVFNEMFIGNETNEVVQTQSAHQKNVRPNQHKEVNDIYNDILLAEKESRKQNHDELLDNERQNVDHQLDNNMASACNLPVPEKTLKLPEIVYISDEENNRNSSPVQNSNSLKNDCKLKKIKECINCGEKNCSYWRIFEGERICHACYVYQQYHKGIARPKELWKIRKRQEPILNVVQEKTVKKSAAVLALNGENTSIKFNELEKFKQVNQASNQEQVNPMFFHPSLQMRHHDPFHPNIQNLVPSFFQNLAFERGTNFAGPHSIQSLINAEVQFPSFSSDLPKMPAEKLILNLCTKCLRQCTSKKEPVTCRLCNLSKIAERKENKNRKKK